MKWISVIIGCLYITACFKKTNKNLNVFAQLTKNEKSLIISCLKCDCVIDELNKIYAENQNLVTSFKIIMDSTCKNKLNPKITINHISQNKLDSISPDFYNMLIIDENGNVKMLKTEQTNKLTKYLKSI